MRRWTIILILLLASALALTPAAAQESTLADLLAASAGGETPEYTTFLTAVQAADPSVLKILSDPAAQITLFVPTDAAFAAYQAALGDDAFNALLADSSTLTSMLLYHIAPNLISYADLSATVQALAALPYSARVPLHVTIPTLQGQHLDVQAGFESLLIDNATLFPATADTAASNGIFHTIDAVLQPETNPIGEIFTRVASGPNPQFVTLTAALNAAGLIESLSDPAAAPVTLFAPTDQAFAEAFAAAGLTTEEALADTDLLIRLLNYHLVAGIVSAADLGGAATAEPIPAWLAGLDEETGDPLITTLNGATFAFSHGPDGEPLIGNAVLLINDVDATNGIIHVISAALLPPDAP